MIVLSYHLISPRIENLYTVSYDMFVEQLNWLKQSNYMSVSLDEIDTYIENSSDNSVAIIFDDGYKNTIYTALPCLLKYNFKAAMAVSSGFITQKVNSKIIPHIVKDMADIYEVNHWLSCGMSICGHTYSHANLGVITDKKKEWQISYDQKNLEKIFQKQVRNFVYPYGFWDFKCINIVRKYYDYAFATDKGFAPSKKHPYNIRRIEVLPNWTLKEFEFAVKKYSSIPY